MRTGGGRVVTAIITLLICTLTSRIELCDTIEQRCSGVVSVIEGVRGCGLGGGCGGCGLGGGDGRGLGRGP